MEDFNISDQFYKIKTYELWTMKAVFPFTREKLNADNTLVEYSWAQLSTVEYSLVQLSTV